MVYNACRLAKVRSSSNLELQDLQLELGGVFNLDHNWSVRLPGYTTAQYTPANTSNSIHTARVLSSQRARKDAHISSLMQKAAAAKEMSQLMDTQQTLDLSVESSLQNEPDDEGT